MPAFDLDSYLNTLEAPAIVVLGQGYIGKILSLREWLPFEAQFKAVGESKDTASFLKVVEQYLYAIYPKSKRFWHKDIVKVIMDSPALTEIVKHFLALQTAAILPKNQRENLTNGSLPLETPLAVTP